MPERPASRHTATTPPGRQAPPVSPHRRRARPLGDKMCIEVFCGAAHVPLAKKPALIEVINDLDGDIPNAFRVLREHPNELLQQMEWHLASKEEHQRLAKVDGGCSPTYYAPWCSSTSTGSPTTARPTSCTAQERAEDGEPNRNSRS